MTLLFLFLTSFAISLLCTPPVRFLARLAGVVDKPGHRRIHVRPTPRLGGLSIFLGVTASLTLAIAMGWWQGALRDSMTWAILLGGPLALLLGMRDDWAGLTPWQKLTGQCLLGLIAYGAGFRIEPAFLGFQEGDLAILSVPLTVSWVVVVMNSINLVDGMDGLAAGICSIIFLTVGLLGEGDSAVLLFALASAGATLGFLSFNFYPASIFMGDTGSMFLGYVAAILSMAVAGPISSGTAIFVPLLLLVVPLVDLGVTVLRRVRRTAADEGFQAAGIKAMGREMIRQVFSPDGDHVHHRLLRKGWSTRKAVVALYAMSLYGSGTVFLISRTSAPISWLFLVAAAFAISQFVMFLDYEEFQPAYLRQAHADRAEQTFGNPPQILRRVS